MDLLLILLVSFLFLLKIAESQRELLEARTMVDKAQRSLSLNTDENGPEDARGEEINKSEERLESAKAATVSAVVGTLASLPISLYQDTSYAQLSLHLAIIFVSCALFGITFRYTVRRDLDNIQLKTGTSAAFGFVRGDILLCNFGLQFCFSRTSQNKLFSLNCRSCCIGCWKAFGIRHKQLNFILS